MSAAARIVDHPHIAPSSEYRRALPEAVVMSEGLSVYLDFTRFAAAMVVFLTHAAFTNYTSGWLDGFEIYGSHAVMVFFVLSGFVIAYVADVKRPTAKRFGIDRAARLYSVVLPALVLTIIADRAGMIVAPELYYCCADYSNPAGTLAASAVFLNEVWFLSVQPFTNVPYWSISYEAWYYALFAVAVFSPPRLMPWLLGLACLAAGPLIMLLAPVWGMGVVAYYAAKRAPASLKLGAWIIVGSIAAFAVFDLADLWQRLLALTEAWLGEARTESLRQSKFFLADYLLGVIVAANFVGAAMIGKSTHPPRAWIARPIRYAAGFTFSLYLFHWPLLKAYALMRDHDPFDAGDQAVLIAMVLVTCWALGLLTEHRKGVFRRAIEGALSWGGRMAARAPEMIAR